MSGQGMKCDGQVAGGPRGGNEDELHEDSEC